MYSNVEYTESTVVKCVLRGNSIRPNITDAVANEIKYLKLFYQDSLDFNSPMIRVPKFISSDGTTIVQEKATGVTLIDYRGHIPGEIFNELIRFFEFANSRNHHHSDISEENLIYDPVNKTMWIIDFGWATDSPSEEDVEMIKLLANHKQWK